jgi:hypothetical protein
MLSQLAHSQGISRRLAVIDFLWLNKATTPDILPTLKYQG